MYLSSEALAPEHTGCQAGEIVTGFQLHYQAELIVTTLGSTAFTRSLGSSDDFGVPDKRKSKKTPIFVFEAALEDHRSGAYAAQIVMKPEFYDKTLEKLDFIVSLIGEAMWLSG